MRFTRFASWASESRTERPDKGPVIRSCTTAGVSVSCAARHVWGRKIGAISSGVERYLDMVEVPGSKPGSPTRFSVAYNQQNAGFFCEIAGLHGCFLKSGYIESRSRTGIEPRGPEGLAAGPVSLWRILESEHQSV